MVFIDFTRRVWMDARSVQTAGGPGQTVGGPGQTVGGPGQTVGGPGQTVGGLFSYNLFILNYSKTNIFCGRSQNA